MSPRPNPGPLPHSPDSRRRHFDRPPPSLRTVVKRQALRGPGRPPRRAQLAGRCPGYLGFSALVSAEGFEEVRGRCAEGTERAGVPRPGRGRGGGGRPQLLLLTGVAGLLGRHDYRGYGASVSLTGATVATHPTTSRAGADLRGSDWTVPGASSMLLVTVHAFQHPLDFSELRFLGSDVRQRKLNPRRQTKPVTRARKQP